MDWDAPSIKKLIAAGLQEDSAGLDVTSRLLLEPSWQIDAVIVAKQNGVVAGLPLAQRFLQALDPSIRFKAGVREGSRVTRGKQLAKIRGRARSILSAERPALNTLQHLSGIATFTRQQVDKLKGTHVKLLDTRKTLPGWRLLQKYAVRCGGALNHRMSLGDAIMIKENHLKVMRLADRHWILRVQRIRKTHPALFVQMEIQTDHDLKAALKLSPQRVLLDNLPPRQLRRMMRILQDQLPKIEIEFTGGIQPENLRHLAKIGPDRISMGRLTHSVPAFDCSLDILRVYPN